MFISYSHDPDNALAAELQAGIEKYARPWNRVRALRVFRDYESLPATSNLWSAIEDALSQSKWFVLMASPEAAASDWVTDEIRWWLDHKPAERLLIVLTSGEMNWDKQASDFDWGSTNAISQVFRGKFAEEPLWVDAIWARSSETVSPGNPSLQDNIVRIVAAIRGVTKDQLVEIGDRVHKRTMRLARVAVASLLTLLVLAVAAVAVAVVQRNTAVRQTRVALAGQLTATSGSELSRNLPAALLLAVQAYRTYPSAQTRAALMRADTASPQLVRYVPTGASVSQLIASGDGITVVAGLADGRVLRWTRAHPHPQVILTMPAQISSLAVDRDGTVVAASDGSGVRLWRHGRPIATLSVPGGLAPFVVGLSPSGLTAVVFGTPPVPDGTGSYVVFSGPQLAQTAVHPEPRNGIPATSIMVPSDDQAVLFELGNSAWERRAISSWTLLGQGSLTLAMHNTGGTLAANGEYFTASNGDPTIPVWRARGKPSDFNPEFTAEIPISEIGSPSATALSADGTSLAIANNGIIYVAPVRRAGAARLPAVELTGNGNISLVTFRGNNTNLLSASGNAVAEWNLNQPSRLARTIPTQVLASCEACSRPIVVISPDGTRAGIVDGDAGVQVIIQPLPGVHGDSTLAPSDTSSYSYGPPVWDGTRHLIVPVSLPLTTAKVVAPSNFPAIFRAWPGGNGTGSVMATAMAGTTAGTVIVVDDRGRIYLQKALTGIKVKVIPGPADLESGSNRLQSAAIHSSPDLVAMVDGGGTRVIDLAHGRTIGRIPGSNASSVVFSGNYLLVQRAGGGLEVWDDRGTALKRTLPAESAYGPPVANQQGTLVARQQSDGSIELDDLSSGAIVDTVPPFTASDGTIAKQGFAFSPDGTRLIVVAVGIGPAINSAELIDTDFSGRTLVSAACTAAGRDLTQAEWHAFVGSNPTTNLACNGG